MTKLFARNFVEHLVDEAMNIVDTHEILNSLNLSVETSESGQKDYSNIGNLLQELESGIFSLGSSPREMSDNREEEEKSNFEESEKNTEDMKYRENYEIDSLENSRPTSPDSFGVDESLDFSEKCKSSNQDAEKIKTLEEVIEKLKIDNAAGDRNQRDLESQCALCKQRIDAKEVEVQQLYSQILEQDQTFAKSYRIQEEAFRQREESMIGKLITEVKDQSNLRIDQQQKLGQQEEKLKNLQRKVEELTEENSKLKDESHRFRNMLDDQSHMGDHRLSYEQTESASNDSSYESEDLRQSYWSPAYLSSQQASRQQRNLNDDRMSRSISMYSLNGLSPRSPKKSYSNRPLGSTPQTTKKVPVPPYLSRYDSGSRQSLTSMAENKNRLNDSRADSRQSLSKTKSISNLSVMSSSTRKMNKSKSTMNLASPSFKVSHSNWDIAERSPKRSPRENTTTDNFQYGYQAEHAATRFAHRIKEYQICEKDLETLNQKRNKLQVSLSKINPKGTSAAARHQARIRQEEIESELDLTESQINRIKQALME